MIVMDSKSGKEIAHLPTPESMDGVYFDATRKRIYVSGGRDLQVGFAYVYQQRDADHYDTIGKVPTRDGAGTSFWSPELDRYCVAAEATDKEQAAILVYAPHDRKECCWCRPRSRELEDCAVEAAVEPFRAATASSSELKVNRQLQLPWNARLVGSRKYRNG